MIRALVIAAIIVWGNIVVQDVKANTNLPRKGSNIEIGCKDSLWKYVYRPHRLQINKTCTSISGIFMGFKNESDGDIHGLLKVDKKYQSLISPSNVKYQKGYLIFEIICDHQITQRTAMQSCSTFKNKIEIPKKGQRISVKGTYVLDLDHTSWSEIHPVSKITILK